MYWYKKVKKSSKAVIAGAIAALLFSCNAELGKNTATGKKYFDIPAYFQQEISRLAAEKPIITKTVTKDSLSETKKIDIKDWETELASFRSIDLNKPAYAGVLVQDSIPEKHLLKITSTDPKTDINKVEIQYSEDGQVRSFHIERRLDKTLYQTQETLDYAKDKTYSIEKQQSVWMLGDKFYHIQADF